MTGQPGGHRVRVIWPILNPALGPQTLIAEAERELPDILTRTHAQVTDPNAARWSIAPSDKVPGSGRITDTVLIYEAPARPIPRRAYWKAAS